jgi:NADH-quinone oxidoreductase subunit N
MKLLEVLFALELYYILPELLIIIIIIILIIYGIKEKKNINVVREVLKLTLIIILLILNEKNKDEIYILGNHFKINVITQELKIVIVVLFFILLEICKKRIKIRYELYIIILIIILTVMLLLSINDLIIFIILIELLAITNYIIAGLFDRKIKNTEVTLKYFLLGSITSTVLVLSIALLYLNSKIVNFNDLKLYFNKQNVNINFLIIIILLILSIIFKLGIVPFQYWLIEIYEGVNWFVLFYFIIISKLIYIVIIFNLFYYIFNFIDYIYINIILIIGILNIMIGTIGGIYQKKINGLLAYSTISNIGFLLISFASNSLLSFTVAMVYYIIYIIIIINIYGIIVLMRYKRNEEKSIIYIEDFKNIKERSKGLTILLTINLLAISGLPPFLGFFSKYYLIANLLNEKENMIASIILLLSGIGIVYYIRLIIMMWFYNKEKKVNIKELNKQEIVIMLNLSWINILAILYYNIYFIKTYKEIYLSI